MKISRLKWQLPLACALAALGTQNASAAGFLALSKTNQAVLQACNTTNSASDTTCRVNNLPGEDGYDLIASRSTPIVINDSTVGTLYEKVWRNGIDSKIYIFGTRMVLNKNAWDESGVAFRVSDAFRRSLPDSSVAVAYYQNGALTSLKLAGRTVQGAGEYSGSQPDRDNSWADARIDVDGAGNTAGQQSPWLLVKTKAGSGIATDPFGIRALNSTAPAGLTEVLLTGYQPTGLPDSGGD